MVALAKSWTFTHTAFASAVDQADQYREFCYAHKVAMLAAGYTVQSSSNGVTSGLADHWNSTADIVFAAAGSNHSWIVYDPPVGKGNPGAGGVHRYLFECTATSGDTTPQQITLQLARGTVTQNGSPIANRPTFAGSTSLLNVNIIPWATVVAGSFAIWRTADGDVYWGVKPDGVNAFRSFGWIRDDARARGEYTLSSQCVSNASDAVTSTVLNSATGALSLDEDGTSATSPVFSHSTIWEALSWTNGLLGDGTSAYAQIDVQSNTTGGSARDLGKMVDVRAVSPTLPWMTIDANDNGLGGSFELYSIGDIAMPCDSAISATSSVAFIPQYDVSSELFTLAFAHTTPGVRDKIIVGFNNAILSSSVAAGDFTITEDGGSDARTVSSVSVLDDYRVELTLDGDLTPGVDNYAVSITTGILDVTNQESTAASFDVDGPAIAEMIAAYAISPSEVLVSFSMPVTGLSDAGDYTITEDMGSDARTVSSVAVLSDQVAILTLDGDLTPGVDNYNVEIANDDVDPAASDLDFSGPEAGNAPIVAFAYAPTASTVRVVFSAPMEEAEIEDETNYTLTPEMGSDARTATAAVASADRLTVVLTLDGDLTEGTNNYTVLVADVHDEEGAAIDTDNDEAVFSGPNPDFSITCEVRPSRELRITFNEPVLDNSALRCLDVYHVTRDDNDAPLRVQAVTPEDTANPNYVDLLLDEQETGEDYNVRIDILERA